MTFEKISEWREEWEYVREGRNSTGKGPVARACLICSCTSKNVFGATTSLKSIFVVVHEFANLPLPLDRFPFLFLSPTPPISWLYSESLCVYWPCIEKWVKLWMTDLKGDGSHTMYDFTGNCKDSRFLAWRIWAAFSRFGAEAVIWLTLSKNDSGPWEVNLLNWEKDGGSETR